ncbi:tyrosine-protein phosphatase non-receptor type substrate 1 [Xenopus tropicalis]|uniref:Tyrosine-protein phosphatase non-receptor type substrate 1 n=3 Tax=Xenopus tropicalis TaxID=8364 RepID=A0A8J1IUF1_XENTR|nr:tyrosine-protein phosphatase non-receptor type substrate 1 [Xenopus tropicalis]XP_031749219.1 tyrosine-protein phosphatase non-receptor type substrate 1 [Xenopus tropicalis]
MAQTSLLSLFLLFLLLQTGAALELTAPPTHRATLGADTLIPCTFRVETPPVDPRHLAIFWYFQDKEIFNVISTVGSSNPRLSLNRDTIRAGVASLSIANVEISDGGLYRCSVLYSPDRRYKEVRLDIQAPPRITLTNNIVIKDKESALSGAITGFYPVDIDIKWLREGEILAGGTELPPQRNADGTYRVTSTVTIVPTEGNRNQNFSIRVQHESLSAPLQEDFQLLYGALPSAAILYEPFKLNMQQILTCRVWGFYPESITVNWFVNGTRVESATVRRVNGSAVESKFLFLPEAETRGTELSCEVQHKTLPEPLVQTLLVQIPDVSVRHRGAVRVAAILTLLIAGVVFIVTYYIIQQRKYQPKVREIVRSDYGVFSLEADNFSPKEITISWEVAQPAGSAKYQPLGASPLMSANQDGSFNVTSTCEHLRDKVSGNEPFSLRATVQHARLKQAVCKEWNSDNEEYQKYLLSVPVMGEITRPTLYHNKEAALLCPISGFFPINLTVTWYKKEKEGQELTPLSPSEMYKIPEISPHKQEDKKFTVTASLVFSPSLTRDNGAEFICRVAHPSLEGAIEKSSGPIHVTLACPKVNEFRIAGDWGLSLEVEEFFPRDIGISWEVVLGNKGKVTSLPCECNISANADGTYRATSACHCLRDQLDSLHTLRVSVQHEALGVPICKGLTQGKGQVYIISMG